jgi:hypothetical protein
MANLARVDSVDKLVARDLNTIVIVWSGETRTHNKDTFDSICRIYSPLYKVIHVGHTWDHCETPCTIGNFTDFQQTNQSEMVNFMRQDPLYFPKLRQNAKSKPDYTWNNSDEYIKLHGNIFKMIWAQMWSHFTAMQLCKKLQNRHNIVGYVRMRWDVGSPVFSASHTESFKNLGFYPGTDYEWCRDLGMQGANDYYDLVVKRFMNRIEKYANARRGYIITDDWTTTEMNSQGAGDLWINDIHWIQVNAMLNKRTKKETIMEYPPPDELISSMLEPGNYQTGRISHFPTINPSAHTLWGLLFDYMAVEPLALIPNELATINRDPNTYTQNPFGI